MIRNSSSYLYNGDGLRVGKTVTKDEETTTTKFVYEYDKVVLELDENGNETAYNVYGGSTLLSRETEGNTVYYLYNGHGDVVKSVTRRTVPMVSPFTKWQMYLMI